MNFTVLNETIITITITINDISIKLVHFYKRCVSKTVVKP